MGLAVFCTICCGRYEVLNSKLFMGFCFAFNVLRKGRPIRRKWYGNRRRGFLPNELSKRNAVHPSSSNSMNHVSLLCSAFEPVKGKMKNGFWSILWAGLVYTGLGSRVVWPSPPWLTYMKLEPSGIWPFGLMEPLTSFTKVRFNQTNNLIFIVEILEGEMREKRN